MIRSLFVILVAVSAAHADPIPPELAEMTKTLSGTWTCIGKANESGAIVDAKRTVTYKAELDGHWIAADVTTVVGAATKHVRYWMTYEPATKRWFEMSANDEGAHGTFWATASGKKLTWEGEGHFAGHTAKLRGNEELVSSKEQRAHYEFSVDDGKTWSLDHEQTCKR